jgi:hypothetical protein
LLERQLNGVQTHEQRPDRSEGFWADGLVTPAHPSTAAVLQMVQQNDDKHEDAHARLRATCREHEGWMKRLEDLINANTTAIAEVRATPPEAGKLRFSPSVVLTIVTISLSIGGGMWASTYGLRSDVRDILTRMALQSKSDEANLRLQDERATALRESIEAMKRRQELQQYELQSMRETMLETKSANRRASK